MKFYDGKGSPNAGDIVVPGNRIVFLDHITSEETELQQMHIMQLTS